MAKILVVDDTVFTHLLLELVLGRNNCEMISAFNVQDAKQRLTEHPVDMIITDIQMPDTDGLAFLEWVRATDSYKNLPVVVLTANPMFHLLEKATSKGATAFLNQPFSSKEIKLLLNNHLNGKNGARHED